jgi:hypothetical protein
MFCFDDDAGADDGLILYLFGCRVWRKITAAKNTK